MRLLSRSDELRRYNLLLFLLLLLNLIHTVDYTASINIRTFVSTNMKFSTASTITLMKIRYILRYKKNIQRRVAYAKLRPCLKKDIGRIYHKVQISIHPYALAFLWGRPTLGRSPPECFWDDS